MLSRVAESIYWMSRYVERAENVARFIDVTLTLMIDDPDGAGQQWQALLSTTGDQKEFVERFGTPNKDSVIQFLAVDTQNPNSIVSCLRAARENARSVREIISSEMWLQLNKFYLMVNSAKSDSRYLSAPHEFFSEVKMASHLFTGIADATMLHSEAWHFCRLGRKLERADKTSRILDVKYYLLLRAASDVGTAFDDIQWAALLRSASAFEMYRKKHGRISPTGVVEFLTLSREFPRAIHYCLLAAQDSLHTVSGTPAGTYRHLPEKLLGQLCSELSYTSVDEIISHGLHEYVDQFQTKLNHIGNGIFETFFATKSPANGRMSQRMAAVSEVAA